MDRRMKWPRMSTLMTPLCIYLPEQVGTARRRYFLKSQGANESSTTVQGVMTHQKYPEGNELSTTGKDIDPVMEELSRRKPFKSVLIP
jgi:hypothetical protein